MIARVGCVVLLIALLPASGFSAAQREAQDYDAAGVRQLRVQNLTGSLTVSGAATPRVFIAAEKRDFGEGCAIAVTREGADLAIRVTKAPGSTAQCGVNFEIVLPPDRDLALANGSGAVTVRGMAGRLGFRIGSGNLVADGTFPEVVGTSGSGQIDVAGLIGSGGIRAGSGSVTVQFAMAPGPGALEIRAGSGDVLVRMPAGTRVAANLRAGNGKVENTLGHAEDAPFLVSVVAGSGFVKLHPN